MIGIPKLVGYGLAASFFAFILIMSPFTIQIQLAYAGGKSPYQSGYDHGCDDTDISDPDDRYINQPEKGPSFHTDEFMDGYHAGYNSCSGGSSNDRESDRDEGTGDGEEGSPAEGRKTLEDLCVQYGSYVGKSPEECRQMVDGNDIKGPGAVFVICNIIKVAGISVSGGLSAILPCP